MPHVWDPEIENTILELGYAMENEALPILGHNFPLDNDIAVVNWENVTRKIHFLAYKLGLLQMPLAIRITYAKTFLLGNLAYTAAIFKPNDVTVTRIEETLIHYILRGGRGIAREKIFAPAHLGGLGVPNIKLFCDALRARTAARAVGSNELWARSLKSCFHYETFNFSFTPNDNVCPTLNVLGQSMSNFSMAYYRENLINTPFFNNHAMLAQLDRDGFNGAPPRALLDPKRVKIRDLLDNNCSPLSHQEVEQVLGTRLDFNTFFKYRGALLRLKENNLLKKAPFDNFNFLLSNLKNSKKIRQYLEKSSFATPPPPSPCSFTSTEKII